MAVRPIDGNELVDTLKQIVSDYTSHGMYPSAFPVEYAIEIVEKMPTLTPPNEWVSVEDRLPRVGGNYICAVQDKNGGKWTIPSEWNLEMKTWFGAFGEIKNKVTHWMPLPAPPDRRPPEQIDMLERMESE